MYRYWNLKIGQYREKFNIEHPHLHYVEDFKCSSHLQNHEELDQGWSNTIKNQ